ncbi:MAG: lysylphosphatidylglycerol synthase domain-containing protein [Pseudobutyrivibrio sp.]|nr:lysylphosphatidylglycerol synthase domain-containing protein [Pseudobutyrivibrio sp.]
MKRKSLVYNWINVLVLLAAALIFFRNYSISEVFDGVGMHHVTIITITVVMVHFLKAFRLYLALYGSGISASNYAKIYCKVTPVSILMPFKLGELFRMYCYGHQINNMLKGIVTVVLDRFMDTIALVTMIIVMWLYSGEAIIPIVYLLVVFLLVAILVFIVFPGLYSYWKKYLLRAKATPRKLRVLLYLDKMNMVYDEIITVSKGRGIILYALSLIAWGVEIGSVVLMNGLSADGTLSEKISQYLRSALSGAQSIELKRFVLLSVVLMIVIYLLVKLGDMACGKERK